MDLKESDVTDPAVYKDRRKFLQKSASMTAMSMAPSFLWPTIGSADISFEKIIKSDFFTVSLPDF